MMKYRNAQGETGIIALTYWTSISGQETSLPPGQQESIAQLDQQLHDMPGHSLIGRGRLSALTSTSPPRSIALMTR
jgi:hypothetical protein